MNYDYNKRDYLLPKGCKNLIDVHREMKVTGPMTVRELADALKQKPFRIMADLMEFKVLVRVNQQLTFKTVSQVARKYGYTAKKAA